ncbi:methionine adenosyltransferase [Candidatus Woesearchaeota archaeon]|nr:methionine adenosyltransferase [Candidatus Woesearchaeota archaeon]
MARERHLFTSESVGEGHPDKVADIISDTILDAHLAQDPETRAGIDTLVNENVVVVSGEITSAAKVDVFGLIRDTVRDIGFTRQHGFNDLCHVHCLLGAQSPEIVQGVFGGVEQGAGDQGIMFGYACNESPELMPLPIQKSHEILLSLRELRRSGQLPFLGPDAKSQVTVEYVHDRPFRIVDVVVSTQHSPDVELGRLRSDVLDACILPVCAGLVDGSTKYHVNPAGTFIVGGPVADAGLTGRKIIVDTYGGFGRHGGGAFSGKDSSKVDRSATYTARYIAKNVVAAELADRCEVQLSYAIGIAEPLSLYVNCFGTNKVPEERIEELVRSSFGLKPAEMVASLGLKRPIFRETASYGAFGRSQFPWESTDKADLLRALVK